MTVAIIGLGEVGRCYAKPLHEAGLALSACEMRPSAPALELARQMGIALHESPGTWLSGIDWVLSCVTGAQSLAVLEQALPYMTPGASFADFTTASANTKRHAAQLARARGMRYVDTAIMGAITLNRVRTPLLAAGDGAHDLQALLQTAGGRVQVIEGGTAGDAMALKILRSIFTKGMEALSVELLMSAQKQGLREKLYEQLADIDDTPLRKFIDMLVSTHVVHAKRREHEVHEAQQALAGQGLSSLVLPGVEQRFHATAARLEHERIDNPEPGIEQALEWLLSEPVAN